MTAAERLAALRARGVAIPSPAWVSIGDEVAVDRIHGPATTLHPGTQLRGRSLLIGPGCTLGAEGPVTVDDCALGRTVTLSGGADVLTLRQRDRGVAVDRIVLSADPGWSPGA